MINLENYSVEEMDAMEIIETDGGYVFPVIRWVVGALVADTAINPSSHWDAFAEGFMDGYQN